MTRQELELKAKEFDSKLKRYPMSSEELQKVLCDFVEASHQPIVSGSYSAEDMSKAWSEGYHRKVDEINGNELRYFDVWLANYR